MSTIGSLTSERQLEAISAHADQLAALVDGRLDALVPACPGWDVADLVEHLIGVHWFWTKIVEDRLTTRFEGDRPAPPPRGDLVEVFHAGAHRMVGVLRAARPDERVWTWAPSNQTVGFVSRHQVQEMVVHHADGASALGASVVIDPEVAGDCVDEFLTYSLSSLDDPKDPPPAPLGEPIGLRASDGAGAWTVADGPSAGLLTVTTGVAGGTSAVVAPAADLLLWLYQRAELEVPGLDAGLIARFRALTYTD